MEDKQIIIKIDKIKLNKIWIISGVIFCLIFGMAAGIGGYTFLYAKGISYMTDKPEVCANCHIMKNHYDAYNKSSHKGFAVCNDCHTPKNFIAKYFTKTRNGYHHSMAFTTQRFHEPIQITNWNKNITEQSCRKCHGNLIQGIDISYKKEGSLSCLKCHRTVGHLE